MFLVLNPTKRSAETYLPSSMLRIFPRYIQKMYLGLPPIARTLQNNNGRRNTVATLNIMGEQGQAPNGPLVVWLEPINPFQPEQEVLPHIFITSPCSP